MTGLQLSEVAQQSRVALIRAFHLDLAAALGDGSATETGAGERLGSEIDVLVRQPRQQRRSGRSRPRSACAAGSVAAPVTVVPVGR
jgi:hypothetical protein